MVGILVALRYETFYADYKCVVVLFQRQILHADNMTRTGVSLLEHYNRNCL